MVIGVCGVVVWGVLLWLVCGVVCWVNLFVVVEVCILWISVLGLGRLVIWVRWMMVIFVVIIVFGVMFIFLRDFSSICYNCVSVCIGMCLVMF